MSKRKRKKAKKIILYIIIVIVILLTVLTIFYFNGLKSVAKVSEKVTFNINEGENRFNIVSDLYTANVIKSKFSATIYVVLTNKKLQAGKYNLDRSNDSKAIINQISNGILGDDNTINLTFVEGKRITDYANLISKTFGYNYDDVLSVFKSQDVAKKMESKYSFLTDNILNSNIYYPLEGYLFPDTYSFYKNATTEDIIDKMLKSERAKIDSLSSNLTSSKYNIHQIITIASIVELEGKNATDRSKIAQVIYTRLEKGMPLEMDTTTYYAVQKAMTDSLTYADLNSSSLYNTRNHSIIGLPVGPICNPSFESLTATLNPSETNYIYFYASKDGTVKFTDSYNEFLTFKNEG